MEKKEEAGGVDRMEMEGEMKKDWKYFWRRVMNDLTNKNLIPVKILFFFKYGTLFVLYPFLTIHMDSLGLNEWEIGVNQATAPVVAILGPPFAGMVADRVGNFKILLSVLTLLNAPLALLLLLVPMAREKVPVPNTMTFDVSCGRNGRFNLRSLDTFDCRLGGNEWRDLPESYVQCGKICGLNETLENVTELTEMYRWNMSRAAGVKRFLLPGGKTSFEPFAGMNNQRVLVCRSIFDVQESCHWEREESIYDGGTTTQQSFVNNDGETTTTISLSNEGEESGEPVKFGRLKALGLNEADEQLLAVHNKTVQVDKVQLAVEGEFVWNGLRHENAICEGEIETNREESNENDCRSSCLVQFETKEFCKNLVEMKEYDWQLTFGVYTAIRIALGFVSATSFIMFEGAVLAIMKQYGGDYGLQRMSATLAAIVAAPLSGLLLKAYGFRPVIYLYAGLQVFSALITLKIDLQFKKASEKVLSNLKEVLSQVEILIFFASMLCAGISWGYLETFLFLFLKHLGGSPLLMGLTITVGGIAGLPLLVFSRPIIKRLGHVNVLCIGMLFYCFRLFGYSLIEDPWACLPFEALEAITTSLAITAASTYAVALSSLQTIASIQGIMGCLYFGIGRGAGSVIGGVLIKIYGHRETFQIFGVISLVTAVLYEFVNLVYLRKHSIAGKGLDINNLNGDPNHNKGGGGSYGEKAIHPGDGVESAGGGFVGPLDVNKFTDIPLDEELAQGHNRV